jgi:crotonobetainyl-CoA:carnitine CoA-transferase CaiB-like acyl-CoA transferase
LNASKASAAPPLAGFTVLEIGGGAAGSYCGRLLVDAGAQVSAVALSDAHRLVGIVRASEIHGDPSHTQADQAYAAYLKAGKKILPSTSDLNALRQLCSHADLVVVGEAAGFDSLSIAPKVASIELSWFGKKGPSAHWQGSDLIVQALTGIPHMAGHAAGSPTYMGDRHASSIGGVTAYIAACAALLAAPGRKAQRFEVNILEANLTLSEMHMGFFERDGIPMRRCGLNRYSPNGPVGIYPCKEGWIGITVTTPDQWRSVCKALALHEQAADERLVTRELRFDRLDEIEAAMVLALASKTSFEWAEIGRQFKIPLVVVPDAEGILNHPIFKERDSLAWFQVDGKTLQVPRTPFGLSATPVLRNLDEPNAANLIDVTRSPDARTTQDQLPLTGITVVDFTMGWAGPLASRLVADLGADVVKIEAGRYPDWWRGVNWTPEYIRDRQYENAKPFCALNRGKRGISIDLTSVDGQKLARDLIAKADVVVENQAAGVMAKFELDYPHLIKVNAGLIMVSMSAFGTGNAWSDTRAYGSTLEQGSGLPSFMGVTGDAPMMAHLAYGDPVGGLYGCAAMLTALIGRRRSGQGQYVNVSMVETMMQFATQPLLEHQVSRGRELRRGSRHVAMAPHGIYPAAGKDRWVAMAVDNEHSFLRLAKLLNRPDWIQDTSLRTLAQRQSRHDELDQVISSWMKQHTPEHAAELLQAEGIAASPVLHADEISTHPQYFGEGFFVNVVRELSGPQQQAGLAILRDGQRLGSIRPAPLLGEHSWEVLSQQAGLTRTQYEALVRDNVITFTPAPTRNLVASST